MNNTIKEQLLEFPCRFPIKIIGINHPDLINAVNDIINNHANDFNAQLDVTFNLSRKANYMAISAMITATSQQQLDNLYRGLKQHSLVKVVL